MLEIIGYQIIDKETQARAIKRIYGANEGRYARRKADRMSNEYGAYRYSAQPIFRSK